MGALALLGAGLGFSASQDEASAIQSNHRYLDASTQAHEIDPLRIHEQSKYGPNWEQEREKNKYQLENRGIRYDTQQNN